MRVTDVDAADLAKLQTPGRERQETLNRLLFPGPTKEFEAYRAEYGDLSPMPTIPYLYGLRMGEEQSVELREGVVLLFALEAISDADAKGMRTVMTQMNGQLRPIRVRDRSVQADVVASERADASNPGHVAAPFAGAVTIAVKPGDSVEAGQTVATIEAMKMEAAINAQTGGVVERVAFDATRPVEGGDLLVVIRPE